MNAVMKPYQSRIWDMALDHLESEWPRRLEAMLKAGTLRKHLESVVDQVNEARYMAQQEPGWDATTGMEKILYDLVLQPNPKEERPLSPSGRLLLKKFKNQIDREAERDT